MNVELIKLATNFVVSTSTGMVVGNTIKATLPVGAGLIKKIGFGIGGLVLGELVGSHASNFVDKGIDETIEQFKKARNAMYMVPDEKPKEENTEGE